MVAFVSGRDGFSAEDYAVPACEEALPPLRLGTGALPDRSHSPILAAQRYHSSKRHSCATRAPCQGDTGITITVGKCEVNTGSAVDTVVTSLAAGPEEDQQLWNAWLSPADFEIGAILGVGGFGSVRHAKHKGNGRFYALKRLEKVALVQASALPAEGRTVSKRREAVLSEKSILSALDHPFVVKLFGSFQDRASLYMVLEYIAGGEFFKYLRETGPLEGGGACFYSSQIVSIFEYCHSFNIVYRDLKPENILMAIDGYIKLTDFGFAKVIDQVTYTVAGTPDYIAPEIFLNKGHGKPADWWSLGVLIYEMLAGFPPFAGEDPQDIYQRVLHGRMDFPKTFFNKEAKGIVKKLLTVDVSKRLGSFKKGAEEVKLHGWFKDLDWDKLHAKAILPPFKPSVQGEADTTQFDQQRNEEDEAKWEERICSKGSGLDVFSEW